MSEREMLERAAAAFGLPPADGYNPELGLIWLRKTPGVHRGTVWSSLHDEGDALRLAVRRGICFGPNFDGDAAVAYSNDGRNIVVPHNGDPYAATRLAITRAAAALAPTAQGE